MLFAASPPYDAHTCGQDLARRNGAVTYTVEFLSLVVEFALRLLNKDILRWS